MARTAKNSEGIFDNLFSRLGSSLRTKLVTIFIFVKVIPLILLATLAWWQITSFGTALSGRAIDDASVALNDSAIENIEIGRAHV
jgi:nitrogen fixation/metabolism regulation signal transduction histidine kinase